MWIDATGLDDVAGIEQLGEFLGLPAVLEDMVTIPRRSKVEEFRALLRGDADSVVHRQAVHGTVSIFTGKDLLSREHPGPVFDIVRKRLQVTGGVTPGRVDYLLYAADA
jgi:Mg2+ and Co2+ transporter CorA